MVRARVSSDGSRRARWDHSAAPSLERNIAAKATKSSIAVGLFRFVFRRTVLGRLRPEGLYQTNDGDAASTIQRRQQ
jgi:hypothetical protein